MSPKIRNKRKEIMKYESRLDETSKQDAFHLYLALNSFRLNLTTFWPKTVLRSRVLRNLEDELHFLKRTTENKKFKEPIGKDLMTLEKALDNIEESNNQLPAILKTPIQESQTSISKEPIEINDNDFYNEILANIELPSTSELFLENGEFNF